MQQPLWQAGARSRRLHNQAGGTSRCSRLICSRENGRRSGVLEETAKEIMAKHPGRRVDAHRRYSRRVGGRGDDRADLEHRPARWIGQQCCRKFHFPDEGFEPAGLQEGNDNRYNGRNPTGRVGRNSELANMAAFLMRDEVEDINGEIIAIDGGMNIMGNAPSRTCWLTARTTGSAFATVPARRTTPTKPSAARGGGSPGPRSCRPPHPPCWPPCRRSRSCAGERRAARIRTTRPRRPPAPP